MTETFLWNKYQFEIYQHDADWNAVPGLYIFAGPKRSWLRTSRWGAYYIGQTEDFSSRIPSHEDWLEALRLGATRVHVRIVEKEYVRESLEKALIAKYRPRLNVHRK